MIKISAIRPRFHLFFLWCFWNITLCFISTLLEAAPLNAVGTAISATHQGIGLSYTSQDNGHSWQLSPTLPPPRGTMDNELNGLYCDLHEQCVAVGFYMDGTNIAKPLVYFSPDHGVSWELSKILPQALGGADDQLTGVACVHQQCSAVGYSQQGQYLTPVSFVSHDQGETWALSLHPPAPISDHTDSHLKSMTCNAISCIAVGYYTTLKSAIAPLIYYSLDIGEQWHVATLPFSANQTNMALLNGVHCQNNYCVTIGSYFLNHNAQPLSYVSQDDGLNWRLSTFLTTIKSARQQTLNAVHCDEQDCVAVGYYVLSNEPDRRPLSYVSHDQGMTWSVSFGLPVAPNESVGAELESVICSMTQCSAIGFYDNGQQTVPLAYLSTDHGQHWQLAPQQPPILSIMAHHLTSLG